MAQCQRMLRENLFKTSHSIGVNVRNLNNEKGFIIDPMIDARAVTEESSQADQILTKRSRVSNDKHSFVLDGLPSHIDSLNDPSNLNFDTQRSLGFGTRGQEMYNTQPFPVTNDQEDVSPIFL